MTTVRRKLASAGVVVLPAQLRRIVRRHMRDSGELYLRYLLTYKDETGETAAREVDRERGWR